MIIIEMQAGGDRWEHEMPRDISEGLSRLASQRTYGGKSLSYLMSRLPPELRDQIKSTKIKSTKIEPRAPTQGAYGVWIDEIASKDMLGDIMGLSV